MMKNIKLFYTFCICLCFLASCDTTRKLSNGASGSSPIEGITDASMMLDLVKTTDLPFTWFGAQGTGTIDWEGERYTAKMNVRIERNKVIWVQIQKLGFEIGRMLITPDSAFFINRLERSYARYSTIQFFKKYNLPADFEMFSKVFTGGAYIPPAISTSVIEKDQSLYLESSSGVNARHWLDVYAILTRSLVTDQFRHEWSAGYSEYGSTNTGQKFPFRRTNSLVIDGTTNLFDLDYSSILIDVPQEFPFSVPSHYEKM